MRTRGKAKEQDLKLELELESQSQRARTRELELESNRSPFNNMTLYYSFSHLELLLLQDHDEVLDDGPEVAPDGQLFESNNKVLSSTLPRRNYKSSNIH